MPAWSPSSMAEPVGPYQAILGVGISGETPAAEPVVVDESVWPDLFARARAGKVVGAMARAVVDGVLVVDDDQRTQLAEAHDALMVQALELEARLVHLGSELDDHGIEWRIVKGPASAHLLYDDPAVRTFVDLDILVRSDALAATVALLEDLGAVRRHPSLGADYERRFSKSVTMRLDGAEIDLHRTLTPGPFGLAIIEDDLFADPTPFVVAGRELATVSYPVALVHACYHAVLGDVAPSDATRRDIAALAQHPDLDPDLVAGLAQRWRGVSVVADGLALGRPIAPAASWAVVGQLAAMPVGRLDAQLRRAYEQRRGRFGRQTIASLVVLDSWSGRFALARSVAWPTAAHLNARDLSRRQHLGRMFRRS